MSRSEELRRGLRGLVAALALLSAAPIASGAGEAAAGAAALDHGDAPAAITAYETLAAVGPVNGHVFYNLGIAYVRAGRPSDAVAAFLAARRFLPRDPDVAANLRFALGKIPDRLDAELPRGGAAPLAMVLDAVTARELALVLATLLGTLGLVVALATFRPKLVAWRRPALLALVLPATIAGLLAAKLSRPEVWGAIAQGVKSDVRAGPGDQHGVLFELHAGAPVLITERGPGGFLKVQLSDGKSGWIAGSQVKVFGPQFGAL